MSHFPACSKKHYRSIWLSDIHLGFRGCQAQQLLNFLNSIETDHIYLVGDIIDLWNMRRKIYWPEPHNEVLHTFFRLAEQGTKVIYVPGNHDELLRKYDGSCFGNIHIQNSAIHTCANGKRLLITHGDQFDAVVRHSKFIAIAGNVGYDLLLYLNSVLNFIRQRYGFGYWSLAAFIKNKVKTAVNFISSFEQELAAEAKRHQADGVVCGHIHKAEISLINDIQYLNCGDWVESCTALIENSNGSIELLDLKQIGTAPIEHKIAMQKAA